MWKSLSRIISRSVFLVSARRHVPTSGFDQWNFGQVFFQKAQFFNPYLYFWKLCGRIFVDVDLHKIFLSCFLRKFPNFQKDFKKVLFSKWIFSKIVLQAMFLDVSKCFVFNEIFDLIFCRFWPSKVIFGFISSKITIIFPKSAIWKMSFIAP